MRRWQFWIVELPALIVTIWYRIYVVLLAVAGIVTITTVLTVLVLQFGFGIRWGW